MNKIERIGIPVTRPVQNANIERQYVIQKASWIWHPDVPRDTEGMVSFRNDFSTQVPVETVIHVSADMRYELFLDGTRISSGPDRSDLWHWSFASYRVALEPGYHRLEALVWWIGTRAPQAQITYRSGFILAAEGELEDVLDTGKGPWTVHRKRGWSTERGYTETDYHVVGPAWEVDGRKLYGHPYVEKAPVEVQGPVRSNDTGVTAPGWQLYPSPLPEQKGGIRSPGRIRAVAAREELGFISADDEESPLIADWQALLDGGTVSVPPDTVQYVAWDLDNYYCGYEQLVCSGGRDAAISLEWAESFITGERHPAGYKYKGNRDEIRGKQFLGFGLHVITDGGDDRIYCAPWWHSGRYILITVRTGAEPLTLKSIGFRETRYPLENEGSFSSSDASMDAIIPLAVRGIQMCSHETLTDCPYYEQLMYVGDTRLQMLIINMLTRDDRLVQRGIELFDWSRWRHGAVAERYPCRDFQVCHTFALIWVFMVYDYSYWRNDPDWVRSRLTGVRSQMMYFRDLVRSDGLMGSLPGWTFIDWAEDWINGTPPAVAEGKPSAAVNLLYVYALRAAADLEEHFGDPDLSRLYYRDADACSARIKETFWQEEKKLFSDDPDGEHYSEHAQCLALITGILRDDMERRDACFNALLATDGLTRTTIYFSYYLFECYYLFNRPDMIQKRFSLWKELLELGLKTPVEMPEPPRSDCHAWGSHPLWHMHASLAGVRPAGPNFRTVKIEPKPGTLERLESVLPHPDGEIRTEMVFSGTSCKAHVELPEGVTGRFVWQGKTVELNSGANELDI